MNKPQKQLQWPEYEVIAVDNKLVGKAMKPGNAVEAIKAATRRADQAVRQLSVEFPTMMRTECQILDAIRCEIAANGANHDRLDRLFTCAHDIKGLGQTYGYPMAALIGNLLCSLIEKTPDATKIPLAVIDQHVDSIKAIVRQNLTGSDNPQINAIVRGLYILDQATLKKIAPAD